MESVHRDLKFKILIPVRNRLETLKNVIQLLQSCTVGFDCTITVSSNNCGAETVSYLDEVSNNLNNFSYLTSSTTLSMAKNFEKLIRHSLSEILQDELCRTWLYVTGADDGLMQKALAEIQEAVSSHPSERVIKTGRVTYFWPNAVSANSAPYVIYQQKKFKNSIKKIDNSLSEVLRGKRSWFSMPFLYTGTFVRADLVAEMFSSGQFYKSQIPDVYSMCELTNYQQTYLQISRPLAISGVSSSSNGKGFSDGDGKRQRQFKLENDISIHKNMFFETWPSGSEYNLYLSESFFASKILEEHKIFSFLWISLNRKNPYRKVYRNKLTTYPEWKRKKYFIIFDRVKYFLNILVNRLIDGCRRVVITDETSLQFSNIKKTAQFLGPRFENSPGAVDFVKTLFSNIKRKINLY